LDRHPLTRLGQFRVKERPIIDLCISPEAAQRLKRLLEEKPDTRQPSEILGLSEEEYYAKIYRDLDRALLMTPEQIKKLRDEYKDVLSGVFEGAKLVCECVGIRVFGLNYSDFADPTTEARQMYKFQHL